MSVGTTYSRTEGITPIGITFRAAQARHPGHELAPHERTSWDDLNSEGRFAYIRLMQSPLIDPPEFLEFDLADNPYLPGQYPGAVPASKGMPADGYLPPGLTTEMAASILSISIEDLVKHLKNFSGKVDIFILPAGVKIYRTVGLTAKYLRFGCVTNHLLGEYWESDCPNIYASMEEWRQKTAVKPEWNGDNAYIEAAPTKNIVVISGIVAMQVVDVVNNLVLAGGARQYFIPNLATQDPELARIVKESPLSELLQQTKFGSQKR